MTNRVDGSYRNLVSLVAKAMHSDDEDQSELLANLYLSGNETEKAVLDNAFICLCGWSLKTLISKSEKEGAQDTTSPAWWVRN